MFRHGSELQKVYMKPTSKYVNEPPINTLCANLFIKIRVSIVLIFNLFFMVYEYFCILLFVVPVDSAICAYSRTMNTSYPYPNPNPM